MRNYLARWTAGLLPLVCSLLFGCQSAVLPTGAIAKVERVVSGQTLDIIEVGKQTSERVRLIGLDAPDLKQEPWGMAAKAQLEQLIGTQTILIESDEQKTDPKTQRRLVYAWRNRLLLNEQLIKDGYALAGSRLPNNKYDQKLAHAQEFARIMELGIWNPNQPMRLSPAEFRQQYR